MTLKELIKQAKDKNHSPACLYTFKDKINIYDNLIDVNDEDNLLSEVYIHYHLCTDSRVGSKVYFYKGIPVAYSTQLARKSDESIHWFSKEAYYLVKNYILSLVDKEDEEEEITLLSEEDLDEEVGEFYNVEYYDHLMTYTQEYFVIEGDKNIDVFVDRNKNSEYRSSIANIITRYLCKKVWVTLKDDPTENFIIDIEDLKIKFF